jgi:hypothetical protein
MSVVRKRNLLLCTKPRMHVEEDFSSYLVRNDNPFISSEQLRHYIIICSAYFIANQSVLSDVLNVPGNH